jgi:hypothetical protein
MNKAEALEEKNECLNGMESGFLLKMFLWYKL